jgi:hypothetical protein
MNLEFCASGYVEQFDTLLAELTVREMLLYTAELKCPLSEPLAKKRQRVDTLLETLALERCANTMIGDSLARGISGGQDWCPSLLAVVVPKGGQLHMLPPDRSQACTIALPSDWQGPCLWRPLRPNEGLRTLGRMNRKAWWTFMTTKNAVHLRDPGRILPCAFVVMHVLWLPHMHTVSLVNVPKILCRQSAPT